MFYCLLAFGQLLILNGIVAVNESSLEVDEWPKSVSMVRSVRAPLATIHSINKPVEPLYTITHTTTAQKHKALLLLLLVLPAQQSGGVACVCSLIRHELLLLCRI